jgi:hypothetical protein
MPSLAVTTADLGRSVVTVAGNVPSIRPHFRDHGRDVDRFEFGVADEGVRDHPAGLAARQRLLGRVGDDGRVAGATVRRRLRQEVGVTPDHVQIVPEVVSDETVDEPEGVRCRPRPPGVGPGAGVVVARDEPRDPTRPRRDEKRERGFGKLAALERPDEERRGHHADQENDTGERPHRSCPSLPWREVAPGEPVAGVHQPQRWNPVEQERQRWADQPVRYQDLSDVVGDRGREQ